jgi:CDP-glucose 4,6-dehydratase
VETVVSADSSHHAFGAAYRGRRVLVTGHTGFKGSWLCEWLLALGAEVSGFSLAPETSPALFDELGLAARMHHQIADIRSAAAVFAAVKNFEPDFVFHLAAQPIVRASYQRPLETFDVNVIGTAHVLDALRELDRECSAVFVTTDKCYENREWHHAYRETDALGGHDPYSASKAAAELVIEAYRRSFFSKADGNKTAIASVRAGNVIGGGDWAADRIVPDAMRALAAGHPVPVRNPRSTRPWQHVLEPLSGYLALGVRIGREPLLRGPFNFGPGIEANRSVEQLITEILQHWPGGKWVNIADANAPHEARLLHLSTDKAFHLLGWKPVWDFAEGVKRTVEWYRGAIAGENAMDLIHRQMRDYTLAAMKKDVPWSRTPPIP